MRLSVIRELIEGVCFQLTRHWRRPKPLGAPTVILFMNTMHGSLDLDGIEFPPGCAITTDPWRYREADAVIFHIPTMHWWHHIEKQPGQLWVAWSLECEQHYPQLRDPAFMSCFDWTMTYKLNSDIVSTYVQYFVSAGNLARTLRREPRPKSSEALAALLISSRFDRSGRYRYARKLMRRMPVHSFGRVLNNRRLANDNWRPSKLEAIANYRFTLAFENACSTDYVTEKFFDPLVAGSVPVYLGAPNVEDFAPGDHCFVNVADFRGPGELAEYLTALAADERRYVEFFEWKRRPFRPQFLRLLETEKDHPLLRLARRVCEASQRPVAKVSA